MTKKPRIKKKDMISYIRATGMSEERKKEKEEKRKEKQERYLSTINGLPTAVLKGECVKRLL